MPDSFNFKKEYKDLYLPKEKPILIYQTGSYRKHHEIYLSDPRKTAPYKLKTVIRHPAA